MVDLWAQVRFSTPSGAMVNTFSFRSASTPLYQDLSAQVAAALTLFYNGGVVPNSLGAYMASWVARAFEIRTYNPADGKPRVPTIYSATLPAAHGGATHEHIPADVCMCLSFHGAPPITRSKRGRIYLGGVQNEWIQSGSTAGLPSFITVATSAADSAIKAMTQLAAASVGWSIYSRVHNTYAPVVGGYVDSEPDTQRRRGSTTASRISWGT